MQVERRRDPAKRMRFEAVRVDLLHRLRRVSDGMTQSELEELTARMTRIRLKYEFAGGMPIHTDISAM